MMLQFGSAPLDRLIDWAALVISGLALAISYRVWRRQKDLVGRQISAYDREALEQSKAQLNVRLTREARGARMIITNAGRSPARNVRVRFNKHAAPIQVAGLKEPIPLIGVGSSFALLVLLSAQDPDQFSGEIRWEDESGSGQREFLLSAVG